MRLVLVGGGNYCVEIESYLHDINQAGQVEPITLSCIISRDPPRFADMMAAPGSIRHVTSLTDYRPEGDERFALALGDAVLRRKFALEVEKAGYPSATIIHPTAAVSASATIEEGAIIGPFVFVGPKARVGRHVSMNVHSSAGHDANIGDYSILSPYSIVNGYGAVGKACFLGTGAYVLPRVEIGDYSKLSVGAAAHRSAPEGSMLYGNPATGRVMFRAPKDSEQ